MSSSDTEAADGIMYVVPETGEEFENEEDAIEHRETVQIQQQVEAVEEKLSEAGLDSSALEAAYEKHLEDIITDGDITELSISSTNSPEFIAGVLIAGYGRDIREGKIGLEA